MWNVSYCKTYFRCILISWFWNVEILLHFNLAFSHCSTSIYQAFDGQTEFLRVFNFTILSYSRNLRKFDAREKYVLQCVNKVPVNFLLMQKCVLLHFILHYSRQFMIVLNVWDVKWIL